MQEAISIYLGGEIITPDLCDYDSYKVLGLKCPFCQSPVFYRQGDTYQLTDKVTGEKTGKEISRKACFAHFKMDAEVGAACEARLLTVEGRKQIEDIQRKSRNQRLRLFERHLPDLLWANEKLDWRKYCKHFGNPSRPADEKQYISKLIRSFAKNNLTAFKSCCAMMSLETLDYIEDLYEILSDENRMPVKKEIFLADKNFKAMVSKELLLYLARYCSEQQFYYLCIWYGGIQAIEDELFPAQNPIDMMKKPYEYALGISQSLITFPWRERIKYFNENKKGFG